METRGTSPLANRRILVTGASGFMGHALMRLLRARGVRDEHVFTFRKAEFDLTDPRGAEGVFKAAAARWGDGPDCVIHLAGYVAGIAANLAEPAKFFYENLMMTANAIEQAHRSGLSKRGGKFVLVGTGSSYPADAPVPFAEEDLWKGLPHPSGAPYGLAKGVCAQMLEFYRRQHGLKSAYVVPINTYGPHDHFDPERSHVIAALVRRCVQAADRGDREIVCWGSGKATRDFLFVDDAAEGILRAAERMDEPTPINVGTGRETTIREAMELAAKAAGFKGEIRWDLTKSDGQMRRGMDVRRAKELLDWTAETSLESGLVRTVEWFRACRP